MADEPTRDASPARKDSVSGGQDEAGGEKNSPVGEEAKEEKSEKATGKVEETAEESKEAAEESKESAQQAEESEEKAKEAATEASSSADLPTSEAGASADKKEETKQEEPKDQSPEQSKAKPKEEPKKDLSADRQEIKVSGKLAGIIKEIEGLSVLELANLVKALEDKFGVTASAPITVAAPSSGGEAGGESETEEGQTSFNVILAEGGANKISVIKAVRELVPSLGLKEAKDLVDAAPKQVLEGAGKDTANEAKQKLEAAGGKVELK